MNNLPASLRLEFSFFKVSSAIGQADIIVYNPRFFGTEFGK